MQLLAIKRALHTQHVPGGHVGVYHGCLEVLVAEQFLDGPYVIPLFEEMGRKAVPQGVNGNLLGYTCLGRRNLEGSLQRCRMHVVTPDSKAHRVNRQ